MLNYIYKYFFFVIYLLTFSFFSFATYADNHFKEEMKNVEDVLLTEHGWNREQLGPMGLSYMIDYGGGESFITLHELIRKKLGGDKRTPICSFFSEGREILFSKEGLRNFNNADAKAARNKYLLYGEEVMSDEDWAMSDKYTWLTYISEGTGSDSPTQFILNKKMKITKCTSHNLEVILDGKSYSFPNLILTMPMYVYLEKGNVKINNHNHKLYEKLDMNNFAVTQMGLAGMLGRIDACLNTTEKMNDKEPYLKWVGADNYITENMEVYFVLASLMTEYVNTIESNVIDTNYFFSDYSKNKTYNQRYNEMYESDSCLEFGESSQYQLLGDIGIGLVHMSSKQSYEMFKKYYPEHASKLKQVIQKDFPNNYLFND